MNKQQEEILKKAARTTLKNEGILAGSNEHINPAHKLKPKTKKQPKKQVKK